MKRSTSDVCLLIVTLLFAAVVSVPNVHGQTKAATPSQNPSQNPGPVVTESRTEAPQVVTIVHRLNGIKLLRLLRRLSGDMNTVATLNNSFAIRDEVHTNIIAGLALEDGRTIAVWLPQAEAELETPFAFAISGTPPSPPLLPGTAAAIPSFPGVAPLPPGASHLTVFARDGNEQRARYIGLDGQTGISVLRISGLGTAIPRSESAANVVAGQRVRLFAPESVAQTPALAPGRVYVRVGASEAKVAQVLRSESGRIEELIARGLNLSPSVIGGVAIDDTGATLGIVQGVAGNDASIIPLETIRMAARRVIERQSSVPRPLLGIRGEAVGSIPMAQMLLKGWPSNEASALWEKRVGIMLTAVVPGTPAAFASLRPGDVILRVNEYDVKSAQDFSALLGQCEAATPVKFTVAKPNQASPQAVTVKLTDAFNFAFRMELEEVTPRVPRAPRSARAATADPLATMGIETLAFGPRAAARLRAQSGWLVVWVKPESIAYRGGVREGDVIETIDNRVIARRAPGAEAIIQASKTVVLGIVRDGQRIHVTVQKPDEKKTDEKKN